MDWDAIKKLDLRWMDSVWKEAHAELLYEAFINSRDRAEWARYLEANPPSPEVVAIALLLGREKYVSMKGRKAADERHSRPNESRDKANRIREIWASGKYSNRDLCAEEECAHLAMSFSSARKALRNTPDPS
jgi:hypothetical protein